jgi:transcriptional regulator with XRE-family HTH domain
MRPEDSPSSHSDPDPQDEYALEVGRRIVQARKEKRMTQVELARKVGVSQRSMQAYENGEVIPYRQMPKLVRALKRPAEWILHGDDGDGVSEKLAGLERKIDHLTELLSDKLDR